MAAEVDHDFEGIIELGEKLTPYAVEIRYPGVLVEEPTIDRAKEAIEIALKIKEFVLLKLKYAASPLAPTSPLPDVTSGGRTKEGGLIRERGAFILDPY